MFSLHLLLYAAFHRANHEKENGALKGQIDVLLKEKDELLQKLEAASGQASSKLVLEGGTQGW